MSTSSSNLELNLGADGAHDAVPAWKQELNERLQATRARRLHRVPEQPSLSNLDHISKTESRASRLAAKVAQRYANAPSYSEILAAETRAAATAAEAAATAARQACAAARALLDGLESAAEEKTAATAFSSSEAQGLRRVDSTAVTAPDGSPFLRQDRSQDESHDQLLRPGLYPSWDSSEHHGAYSAADPVEEAFVSPAQPLPVNLIEFPRELVAVRRARPRLAEGPLRESSDNTDTAHGQSQLRIFEVEAESISKMVEIEAPAPEWSSIRLDAKPSSMLPREEHSSSLQLPLKSAPLEDRLMAGIFDVALVLLAFVLFILIFTACTTHLPSGKPALFAVGLVLLGLSLLYQYLFFRFTEGTPGMRYAKIALCTFEDENPTRKAMRRRILFLLLSAAPFGMGFAWAWFDPDRLGWHDRLTRMYQRSYR